jgi:hypothetical protein
MRLRATSAIFGVLLLGGGALFACSSDDNSDTLENSPDAGSGSPDTGTKADANHLPETSTDSSAAPAEGGPNDSGTDTGPNDSGSDAGTDSSPTDGGTDAKGGDAGKDANGTDTGTDAETDGATKDGATSDAGDSGSISIVCPTVDAGAGADAGANLLKVQPLPSNWDDSFGGKAQNSMTSVAACGFTATKWAETGVKAGQWIKIYPDNDPFLASLQAGTTYVASVTVVGTGTYHLVIWDGNGGKGIGNNPTQPVVLSPTAPTTLTTKFTMGTGTPPEFQIVVDGTGNVDTDLTMWDLAITTP